MNNGAAASMVLMITPVARREFPHTAEFIAIASKSNQISFKGRFSDEGLDSALMGTWLKRQWRVAIPSGAHWP
jgi:hypothetical protein